jgi:hypothetical protein
MFFCPQSAASAVALLRYVKGITEAPPADNRKKCQTDGRDIAVEATVSDLQAIIAGAHETCHPAVSADAEPVAIFPLISPVLLW